MAQPIFLYWHQGWDKAPAVSKACLNSWQILNDGEQFNVIALDFESLSEWLDNDSPEFLKAVYLLERLEKKHDAGSLAFFSDYLRVVLLHKHGGIWADATLFCLKPLATWLPHPSNAGFPLSTSLDRLFEVWFIDNRAKDPIIGKWKRWLETPHLSIKGHTSYLDDWSQKKHQIGYWLLYFTKRSWVLSASIWNSPFCTLILKRRPYFMVNYTLQKALMTHNSELKWHQHILPIQYRDFYTLMSFSDVKTELQAAQLIENCPFVKLSYHMTYWEHSNEHGLSLSETLDLA